MVGPRLLPVRSILHSPAARAGGTVGLGAPLDLKLFPITKCKADSEGRFGDTNPGYRIAWKGVPAGVPVELCVARPDVAFNVTHGFKRLELWFLLEALRYLGIYGKSVEVWLRVKAVEGPNFESNRQKLIAPVKPLPSPITIRQVALEQSSLPYLCYDAGATDWETGKQVEDLVFAGRLLSKNMDGYRYFVRKGYLEGDNRGRGFDCITFAATMLGLHLDLTGKTATVVAETIGAEPCGFENVTGPRIIRSFAPGEAFGYHHKQFIAYHMKHVVLITGGNVYEFSLSHRGYRCTPGHQWTGWGAQTLWTIRKIPEKYQFKMG